MRSGVVAGKRYPLPEARGSGQECQDVTAQEQWRGVTPCRRPGTAARRSYPMPEVGAVAKMSNPTSKEQWLLRRRRA